jgi:hypothetical protein
MRNILTADQFLTSVLAMLRLSVENCALEDESLDIRFERAYETLRMHEAKLKVTPNFTFFRDPLHGNSAKLRNALLNAKESGLLGIDSSRNYAYLVKMDEKRARVLLDHSPLTQKFLKCVVNEHFAPRTKAVAR